MLIYYTRSDLQLRDIVALSAVRKSRVDTGIEPFVSLINKHYSLENMRMHRRNTRDTIKQKLEPVSSTSRRGARAAYHDEYPRDFGPRIAYTVS